MYLAGSVEKTFVMVISSKMLFIDLINISLQGSFAVSSLMIHWPEYQTFQKCHKKSHRRKRVEKRRKRKGKPRANYGRKVRVVDGTNQKENRNRLNGH